MPRDKLFIDNLRVFQLFKDINFKIFCENIRKVLEDPDCKNNVFRLTVSVLMKEIIDNIFFN